MGILYGDTVQDRMTGKQVLAGTEETADEDSNDGFN